MLRSTLQLTTTDPSSLPVLAYTRFYVPAVAWWVCTDGEERAEERKRHTGRNVRALELAIWLSHDPVLDLPSFPC